MSLTPRSATTSAEVLSRARRGVAATFFLTGAIFATWAARTPSIKDDLDLGNGDLAIAFMGLNLGAILGLQVGGIIVARWGADRRCAGLCRASR